MAVTAAKAETAANAVAAATAVTAAMLRVIVMTNKEISEGGGGGEKYSSGIQLHF